MKSFSDGEARKVFAIGITEMIAKIYEISDNAQLLNIFNKLSALDDDALVSMKDLMEGYFDTVWEIHQTGMRKLIKIENAYMEAEEKKEVVLDF